MMDVETLAAQLTQRLGGEHVVRDAHERALFGMDVYEAAKVPPVLVVRPGTTAELSDTVRTATQAGFVVVPRGAGMSYTGGYLPVSERSVTIDMSRMNRVLEINVDDMYVRVEAGVSWAQLHDALSASAMRTPMWGTLSGLRATVGGGLSQNSIFFGSGLYGSTADSVLGLEVVLADGTVLPTGSAAVAGAAPFFRWYGPDLTGLFLGDTGAFGVKATATLKLIPAATETRFVSAAFDESTPLYAAMAELAREQLVSESFAFDPGLQRQRLKRAGLGSDLKALKGVMTGERNLLKGVIEGAKVAVAGRRFMDDVKWSLHATVEGRDADYVKRCADRARDICARHGGREIENTIPKVMRGTPFGPLISMLGPLGERWIPVHGLMPLSHGPLLQAALDALWAKHADTIERHKIAVGQLAVTVATNAMLLEPIFWWESERLALHDHALGAEYVAKLTDFPADPDADAFVRQLRGEVAQLFLAHGCTHFQIGKSYPYRQGLRPEAWRVVEGVKSLLDPDGAVNPGSLGLASGTNRSV
jgi:FAD/FMN-containing dehydrogenase